MCVVLSHQVCHHSFLQNARLAQTPHPPTQTPVRAPGNPLLTPNTHIRTQFPNQQPGAPSRSDPHPLRGAPHHPLLRTSGPLLWSPGLPLPCSSGVRTAIPDACLSLPLSAQHCPAHARPLVPDLWPTVLPGSAFASQDFWPQWGVRGLQFTKTWAHVCAVTSAV